MKPLNDKKSIATVLDQGGINNMSVLQHAIGARNMDIIINAPIMNLILTSEKLHRSFKKRRKSIVEVIK